MGLRPDCDIFGTIRPPIDKYRISIRKVTATADTEVPPVLEVERDLSVRGLKRLVLFVARGINPPSGAKEE